MNSVQRYLLNPVIYLVAPSYGLLFAFLCRGSVLPKCHRYFLYSHGQRTPISSNLWWALFGIECISVLSFIAFAVCLTITAVRPRMLTSSKFESKSLWGEVVRWLLLAPWAIIGILAAVQLVSRWV